LSDEAAIRAPHEAWLAGDLEGRIGDVLAHRTEDVALHAPGADPIRGRQARRRFPEAAQPPLDRIETTDLVIRVEGGRARLEAAFATWPARALAPVRGRHVWHLRRGWLVERVAWWIEPERG
jgi:hypothetical protein